ncbi:histone-like nucleoid-structuring protein Lsr2 [Streptomyces sp. NPDC088350]|uniref:Lsr2 dimerization domain-containing protein n=1 Tax=Streptomyces sp. NPDC088350 TaxID=3365854 RepID=UPI0037F25AB5
MPYPPGNYSRPYPRDSFNSEELAAETVFFSLDDSDYVINLTEERATKLRAELVPFIEKARKVGEVGIISLYDQLDKENAYVASDAVIWDEPYPLGDLDFFPPGADPADYFEL